MTRGKGGNDGNIWGLTDVSAVIHDGRGSTSRDTDWCGEHDACFHCAVNGLQYLCEWVWFLKDAVKRMHMEEWPTLISVLEARMAFHADDGQLCSHWRTEFRKIQQLLCTLCPKLWEWSAVKKRKEKRKIEKSYRKKEKPEKWVWSSSVMWLHHLPRIAQKRQECKPNCFDMSNGYWLSVIVDLCWSAGGSCGLYFMGISRGSGG